PTLQDGNGAPEDDRDTPGSFESPGEGNEWHASGFDNGGSDSADLAITTISPSITLIPVWIDCREPGPAPSRGPGIASTAVIRGCFGLPQRSLIHEKRCDDGVLSARPGRPFVGAAEREGEVGVDRRVRDPRLSDEQEPAAGRYRRHHGHPARRGARPRRTPE